MATEIVTYIRSLDPPGRFLRKVNQPKVNATEDEQKHQQQGTPAAWEELPDERAIHKACQGKSWNQWVCCDIVRHA